MLMTHWTEYKKSHGLNPGDMLIVRGTGRLIRYVGIAMNGIQDTPYDKELLEFSQPIPVHPFNYGFNQNYFLATKESSSQGFVDPSTVLGLEKLTFLNEHVKDLEKDLEKVGNIPQLLWMRMGQEAVQVLKKK